VSRAADWVNYDRLALAEAMAGAPLPQQEPVGARLRSFWREYDGVTRLRASLSREVARGLALVVTGENLLGEQRGEPDDITVLPGRTVTAGIRARF
jgi:iron complex outermembrane receptor protein